jgi:hypothetical protein
MASILVGISVFLLLVSACGSQQPETEGHVFNSDAVYQIDDLTDAGYQKPKQVDLDTIPDATDSWFGFFQQKNVQVFFYADHETALTSGTAFAEKLIATKRTESLGGQTSWAAFAITGNAVLLCELLIDPCLSLIEGLRTS